MFSILRTSARVARTNTFGSLSFSRAFSSSPAPFQHILTETQADGSVGVITLNRPKALNALCDELITEVNAAVASFEGDAKVGAMVITGSERCESYVCVFCVHYVGSSVMSCWRCSV
jgi:1,4-dihydroxy-2-naphthoyl-CoA synthase